MTSTTMSLREVLAGVRGAGQAIAQWNAAGVDEQGTRGLRVAPQPAVLPAVPSGLGACGGDLPPCWVKQRESGGSYAAYNPTGCSGRSCGGAWQFDPLTWNNYGGYPQAQMAPPAVQDAKARELWAGGAGCSHWAAC